MAIIIIIIIIIILYIAYKFIDDNWCFVAFQSCAVGSND
jgi:amino acid permease